MLRHFIFGNQSLLAILLASAIIFWLAIVIKKWIKFSTFIKAGIILLTLGGIYILFITNGRAALIGFIAAVIFLVKKSFHLPKFTKLSFSVLAVFAISLLFFLFWLKKDSSYGRVLIYKISANIFKDHWLWGIGIGKFKRQYNLYQADYFFINDIDSKEALLADNTFYAFNDTWQLLFEVGVVGFVFLLIAAILLIRLFKNYKIQPGKAYLFYAGASALLCIAVASFFSYPFHLFSIQLLSIGLLMIILSTIKPTEPIETRKRFLSSAKILCCLSFLLLCFYGYKKIMLLQKSKETFDLSQAGFKTKALQAYSSLNSSFKDFSVMNLYAKQLYSSNRLEEARNFVSEIKDIYTDNEVYKLSASIAYEQGDFKLAEKDYLIAMYMVPNRMVSRYELYNFYLNTKDTAKAIYWGSSILSMPVKVPSERTMRMQLMVRKNLQNLQKLEPLQNLPTEPKE